MSERSHVDKYLCTVCGHRHSNGWYCKHSIDAKDATIAELRVEVERQAKVLVMYETLTNGQSSELTQLHEDRRVLAENVNEYRSEAPHLKMDSSIAVDASGVLERTK